MMYFNGIQVQLGNQQVLQDISFSLPPHKITAVLGKNGSGKSTLLSCVTNGVAYTGEIQYGERNVALMSPRERAQLIAVLPQSLPRVSLTVEELVRMGRNPYLDLGRRLTNKDREQIEMAIQTVGLEALCHKPVSCLSGGERQKAYIAMILSQNTRIVLLDEPTTYMDMENESELLRLLEEMKTKHKKTLLVVMHDLTKAVEVADTILILDGGKQVFFGSSNECVQSGLIEETFGVQKSVYNKDGILRPLYYR